jgi:hypothetical protein
VPVIFCILLNLFIFVQNIIMEIEKNIPVPPPRKKYHFNSLQVGESILFECEKQNVRKLRNCALSSANSFVKFSGLKRRFVTRTVSNGFRIWRVE